VQRLSNYPFEPWLIERIAAAKSIALMTHVGPDADGLGSQMAFYHAAALAGIQVFVVNEDPLPQRYSWLDAHAIAGHFDAHAARLEHADLGLIFDTNDIARAARPAQTLLARGIDLWVVDHHAVSADVDITGIVATDFSSSGELVFQLIKALGWPIDADVARGIYAAISFDTGSFRFIRNQSRTFRVAAELLDTGLDTNPIQEALFASRPRQEIVLLGRVLNQLHFAVDGRIAWAAVNDSIHDGLDVAPDALGEMIPTLIGMDGVLIAMMLKPGRQPNEWKLSLRSKTAVKIGAVAAHFGGGGHAHAAGATIYGDLAELAAQVLAMLEPIAKAA